VIPSVRSRERTLETLSRSMISDAPKAISAATSVAAPKAAQANSVGVRRRVGNFGTGGDSSIRVMVRPA
jgi:hypothetical protein